MIYLRYLANQGGAYSTKKRQEAFEAGEGAVTLFSVYSDLCGDSKSQRPWSAWLYSMLNRCNLLALNWPLQQPAGPRLAGGQDKCCRSWPYRILPSLPSM
jgi:hypothetical protein